jgi:hypothetical protein
VSAVLLLGLAGCATESHQALEPPKPAAAATAGAYRGPRSTLMVGKFDNRSSYMRGLFSDGVDRLGGQAKTILIGHLQETGRFNVVDRENMDEIAREARIRGQQQTLKGADFALTGDVVEFGRKEVGDRQLFGILGSGKQQVAYSKVTVNVVNVLLLPGTLVALLGNVVGLLVTGATVTSTTLYKDDGSGYTTILAAYSAGLALAFVLAAIAFVRAMGAFRWLRDHYDVIRIVSGSLLVLLGLAFFFHRDGWIRVGFDRALDLVGLGT